MERRCRKQVFIMFLYLMGESLPSVLYLPRATYRTAR